MVETKCSTFPTLARLFKCFELALFCWHISTKAFWRAKSASKQKVQLARVAVQTNKLLHSSNVWQNWLPLWSSSLLMHVNETLLFPEFANVKCREATWHKVLNPIRFEIGTFLGKNGLKSPFCTVCAGLSQKCTKSNTFCPYIFHSKFCIRDFKLTFSTLALQEKVFNYLCLLYWSNFNLPFGPLNIWKCEIHY